MTVKTISSDDVQTADGAESTAGGSLPATGIDEQKPSGSHDDLLRSASALTASTLWSMIEADTESVMFLAEGGGEVPLFEPEETPDDAVDPAAQTR